MRNDLPDDQGAREVSDQDARAALEGVVASDTFAGSDRLVGFLKYVVEEQLRGRGDAIRAKSIALDVYGYEPDEIERRESVVRVDAGRLRRKLQAYYEAAGKDAEIRIELPKGGYVPEFRAALEEETEPISASDRSAGFWPWLLGGAVLVFAVVVTGVGWRLIMRPPTPSDADASAVRRSVLFDTSPERLEAANLAEQGRKLIFPATDPKRLSAALLVFESSIQLDESYAGGHAGAAQVYGLRAILAQDKVEAEKLQDRARNHADRALQLSPGSAWAVSAKAWSEFSIGDHEVALFWSDKATRLAPMDPHVLEFDALIALYSGKFRRVLERTEQATHLTPGSSGYLFQNARSAAFYHLGEYRQSIDGFEAAIAQGGPTGPVTVAYLMAANHQLGESARARNLAVKYMDNWPRQRVDLLFARLFADARYGDQLARGMRGAGWTPE